MVEFSGAPPGRRLRAAAPILAGVMLVALPWLWPFTAGPSANVWPQLASWTCLALLALLAASVPAAAPAWQAAVPLGWLLAALVSSAIALAQWFGVLPAWPVFSPARLGEAYANLRQRNQFATLTGIGLACLVFLWPGRAASWKGAAIVLLALANAASASRTGLLQWVCIAGLAAAWPGPRRERLVLAGGALAAYCTASLLLPQVLAAWRGVDALNVFERTVSNLGCSSRRVLWDNVAHLIAQRPWTGWGWGELDYAHYATLYDGERFCEILDNAHNLPLHLAVELGIPAAVLAVGSVMLAVWRGRPHAERVPLRQLAWAVLGLVAVHSLLEYPLWYGPFQVACLVCVVVLAAPDLRAPRLRAAVAAGSACVLLGVVFVQAAYDRVAQAYLPAEQRRPAARIDPIAAAGDPVLFSGALAFAELGITPLSAASAARVHALAVRMVHFSPEPAVLEKLVESAAMLGREEEALWHAARFRAAFPDAYRQWVERASGLRRPVQRAD